MWSQQDICIISALSLDQFLLSELYLLLRELQIEQNDFRASIHGDEALTFFLPGKHHQKYNWKFSSKLILNVLFTNMYIPVGCSWQDSDPDYCDPSEYPPHSRTQLSSFSEAFLGYTNAKFWTVYSWAWIFIAHPLGMTILLNYFYL